MAKVTGLGGVFFKSDDRDATAKWFNEVLKLPTETWGRAFPWLDRETKAKGYTVLGLHESKSDYFTGSSLPFMLNLRVDDLDGMLKELEGRGVKVLRRFPPEPNGKFAHVAGPGGVTLELWEPVENDPYDTGP
jgi:predicted enzyme related to lactoylglutathione lyase